MKISPYLSFNGNCAEAIGFYEKVFGVTAKVFRYKDAPPPEGYKPPQGTENNIMHASLTLDQVEIFLCDVPPDMKCGFGGGMSIMLTMNDAGTLKSCFGKLKEGGQASMELQETFWSKCFGMLTDKFGVNWMLSI